MSELSVNGNAIVSLHADFQRENTWRADLLIDADVTHERGDLIELSDASGTVLMRGRVLRSDTPYQRCEMRIVGGYGRLATRVAPKYYRSAPARTILEDLARDSGTVFETGVLTQPEMLTEIVAWVRRGGEAVTALQELIRDALPTGWTWRARPNGEMWIGLDTWPEVIAVGAETIREIPARGEIEISGVTLAELLAIEPGMLYGGKPVHVVRIDSDETKLRGRLTTGPTTMLDPIVGLVRKGAQDATAHTAYHVLYSARVVQQDADTGAVSVVLQPDLDEALRTMPALTEVPLRAPFPGGRVLFSAAQIASGAVRVLVGFEDGHPAKPYAVPWATDAPTVPPTPTPKPDRINIDAETVVAINGDARRVARVNDTVGSGTVTAANGGGPVTFTFIPEGGGPPVISPTLTITGKITTGSEKLKTG